MTPATIAEELSEEGYAKTLTHRQVTMIAIGGAIGVGLFMGAGGRLASVGPALIGSYALGGVLAFFLMRAIGELIMYRRPRARSSPTRASSTAPRAPSSPAGPTSSTGG